MPEMPPARKKSPRAPSIALDEALERVMKAYDAERLRPAPTEVMVRHLGYKGVSSSSALSAMASLRYYGLLERPGDGLLAVTKEVEAFKFAPDAPLKQSLLSGFLRRPALFAELLDKYVIGLPSDANLKRDLIQRGFLPATAASVASVLRRSVEFTHCVESQAGDIDLIASTPTPAQGQSAAPLPAPHPDGREHDHIPVRLPGSRRAWLVIPTPFYAADKLRLKAQIDLLLTEEDGIPPKTLR